MAKLPEHCSGKLYQLLNALALSGRGREPQQTTCVRMAGVEGVTRSERATGITMGALLCIPFCPYEGQRVGMGYLAAEGRYTTLSASNTILGFAKPWRPCRQRSMPRSCGIRSLPSSMALIRPWA